MPVVAPIIVRAYGDADTHGDHDHRDGAAGGIAVHRRRGLSAALPVAQPGRPADLGTGPATLIRGPAARSLATEWSSGCLDHPARRPRRALAVLAHRHTERVGPGGGPHDQPARYAGLRDVGRVRPFGHLGVGAPGPAGPSGPDLHGQCRRVQDAGAARQPAHAGRFRSPQGPPALEQREGRGWCGLRLRRVHRPVLGTASPRTRERA